MTGNLAALSGFALAGCLIGVDAPCATDAAQAPASWNDASAQFEFDLPAQPLAEAIKRYASITHRPTLARGELVAGRSSSAVQGVHSPETALQLLLADTGLVAEAIPAEAGGGFVLKPAAIAPAAVPREAELGDLAGYPGLVQARVWQALCGNPQTAPGSYRSLLRFQVDASGQIRRVRLLGSTGSASRDAAVQATLQALRIDRPPPSALPQPLTMFIEPHATAGGPLCAREAS
ncbi:TonB family protein [Variovorax sp.]|uniref:TonB family protein n=1 Tax=Variovorax sp. TaxID=1871043 RepID=UPI001380986B|nr:TonB family protein [Variovorax sp.]KAF1073152.1 MAG: hypothetical protein GAK39_00033 [Variovorax sp.]